LDICGEWGGSWSGTQCFSFENLFTTFTYLPVIHSSADSLEEVVGLDIGYTGGYHKRRISLNSEMDGQIDDYLQEYEHRKREKTYLRKHPHGRINAIPASSIHDPDLHGNSYHGRRIITSQMIESLDVSGGSQKSNKRSSQGRPSYLDGSGGSQNKRSNPIQTSGAAVAPDVESDEFLTNHPNGDSDIPNHDHDA
jgi:hypothetical protein